MRRIPRALRFTAFALAAIALLMAAGATYQVWRETREAEQFPPPGMLVDIGGRKLHLVCSGAGEPAVIFEASGFGSSLSFSVARDEIALQTQVCSYDRAGTGWSDPAPGILSVGLLADDLHALLERAELPPPYILVPSSIGGLTVELFARRHPDQVAGLVFLDAANSDTFERRVPDIGFTAKTGACLLPFLARIGALRIFDPWGLSSDGQGMALMYRTQRWQAFCAFARGVPQSAQEIASAPALPIDVPLVVLSHEKPEDFLPRRLESWAPEIVADWYPSQQRFAAHSMRGSWRVVPGSGHLIASSQPREVARTILEMLAEVRAARP
jgi:pimeloyl-ACP methyl ester carboxylesterase